MIHLRHDHVLGMAHGAIASLPTDEKPRPIKVTLFGLRAIVLVANALTELAKLPNRAQNGSGDFVSINIPVHINIYIAVNP